MMNNKNSAAFEYHFPGLESEPFEFCHEIMEPSINGRYGGMDFFYGSRLVFMRLNTDGAAGKQRTALEPRKRLIRNWSLMVGLQIMV